MIEIKSRKEALEHFGPRGLGAWDHFDAGSFDRYHCMLFRCTFVRPEKLKPLTDAELVEVYNNGPDDFMDCLRAVVDAHDARLAEIKLQEEK